MTLALNSRRATQCLHSNNLSAHLPLNDYWYLEVLRGELHDTVQPYIYCYHFTYCFMMQMKSWITSSALHLPLCLMQSVRLCNERKSSQAAKAAHCSLGEIQHFASSDDWMFASREVVAVYLLLDRKLWYSYYIQASRAETSPSLHTSALLLLPGSKLFCSLFKGLFNANNPTPFSFAWLFECCDKPVTNYSFNIIVDSISKNKCWQ